jgi:sugar phosphate isomerase/epimerase
MLPLSSGEYERMINRRIFVGKGVAAAAVFGGGARLFADPLGLPIGCQTYSVRSKIDSDFAGTMRGLRAAGYTHVELCSPFEYPEFKSLQRYKPQELRRMLNDWGLTCISAHWVPDELFEKTDDRIAYAKEFGMTQMVVPLLGPFDSKGTETPDDVKRYVEQFNAFAEKAHAAGISALLHNEAFVSTRIDGKPVYDMMIAELNPVTTKLQFQVSALQQGFDPVIYFHKYPGRFLSMHCQDWVKDSSSKTGFRAVSLGRGVVDWKALFTAAKVGGVKNYFVEFEDDPALLSPSVIYLQNLNV